MQIISFLSNLAMPLVILLIVTYGLIEKNKVFDDFLEGAKEGLEMVIHILPTLVGLFVAIGALRSSGILDKIIYFTTPLLSMIHFPSEIMPLAMLRPISGSGSIAVATDIMKNYGVDSTIGMMASTIMGSTETTLYTIAIYTSCVKIKKTRFVLWASLLADLVGILVSVVICSILS
ncbi:MAG: spore maturation protein [Clostridia bacterium]|nr:spore maturation protein [Clostridia bacterium]